MDNKIKILEEEREKYKSNKIINFPTSQMILKKNDPY